ncbi:uncharacterized protein LOC141708755 [Apium graveolens]|uniref:uncharacterized protein LOC141708755 n=1 Tax=Apium graveolens TaxID=4045 RepID=UPI003D7BA723
MATTQITESQSTQTLIKQLASCNKSTRDKALKLLKQYLQSQDQISHEELKKIWKGLFFTVWHADKAPVQSDLINSLSCLLYKLPFLLSVEYFSVFLVTMRREWTGIDGHRLDKFYLLIRRFVNAGFVLMKRSNWDLEVVKRFVGVLENRVFFAKEKKGVGNGVSYHVASVFLDELKGFLPVRKEVGWVLFGVLFGVMGKCNDKVLIGKIKSNVFEVFVRNGRELVERKKVGEEVEDETMRVGSLALSMGFAEKFFELGSSVECVQVNRKVLFGLHEEFLKLEKDFEASGVEILVPEGGIEDEEEVPDLIPIVSAENGVKMAGKMENGASVSKASKKKKKVKKEMDGSSKKQKKNVVPSEELTYDDIRQIYSGSYLDSETANDGINATSTELITNSGEMENGTSASKASKKKKKVKKDADGSGKKKKKDVVPYEELTYDDIRQIYSGSYLDSETANDGINGTSTELITNSGEMENGTSASKASKKKKKVKKDADGSGKKKKKDVVPSEELTYDDIRQIYSGSYLDSETANDGINGTSTELITNSGEMENGTSASKASKKKKKVKKDADGSSKKKKKNAFSSESKDDDMVIANGLDSSSEPVNNENLIDFNESVVSNLRIQFEKVATEVGLDKDGSSSLDSPEVPIALISKKRKRARSVDEKMKKKPDFTDLEEKDAGAETSEKSAKKVRFSIKNNIVWKPHSPMPPQEMRLPPSATPRGSALKKGLSPGPIREMPPATKKPMLKKKGLRGNARVAPAVKRLRKMQGQIA